MTFEGEQSIVADHAMAVVGDADEFAAAGFDLDTDASGAGVNGVLKQFLDDGGRTLDDLAGGDLVRDLVGEDVDAAHESIVVGDGSPGWSRSRTASRLASKVGERVQ